MEEKNKEKIKAGKTYDDLNFCPVNFEKDPDCLDCCANLNCTRGQYLLKHRGELRKYYDVQDSDFSKNEEE